QLASDPELTLEEHEIEVGTRIRRHKIVLIINIPSAAISTEIIYEQEEGDSWIIGINVGEESITFKTTLNTFPEETTATIILSYTDIAAEDTEAWDKITITQMASGNDGPPEEKDFNYVKGLPLGLIDENISIVGNIVSTGVSDNFRKDTYIIQNEK